MITNRTQYDVDTAILIRNTKVKKFEELTENDINYLERGTLTINTLNRIEAKQEELKNLFNDMGYWNTPIVNKVWNYTQIFDIDEFNRIVENVNILRKAFFTYKNTPNTPTARCHFENINDLEKILNDLDVMINDVKSRYKRCGTFRCGELIE